MQFYIIAPIILYMLKYTRMIAVAICVLSTLLGLYIMYDGCPSLYKDPTALLPYHESGCGLVYVTKIYF